jgi:hypothetical protein
MGRAHPAVASCEVSGTAAMADSGGIGFASAAVRLLAADLISLMGFGAAMARGADGLAPMTFTGDKLAGQAQEAAGSVSLPGPEQPAALLPGGKRGLKRHRVSLRCIA